MNIVIHEKFKNFVQKPLEDLGHTVSTDDLNADMVVGYPSQLENLKDLKNLKYVQLFSAGYDGIDLTYLKKHNIKLFNARGVYSSPIAQYILTHVLAVYNQVHVYKDLQRKKVWHKEMIHPQILGKRVLYLGTGSIGSETAKRFKALGTRNVGFNSNGRGLEHFDETYPLSKLNDHLPTADIIVASLPDNDYTRHLIGKKEVKLMKQGSIFVNVGRGTLVDEEGIKDDIDHLSALILDVFETEPLPEDSYLWDRDNVIVTPHIAANSDQNETYLLELLLNNLDSIENKKPYRNLIEL